MTNQLMIEQLRSLAQAGQVRQLDLQCAIFMAHLGADAELVLAAALTSYELGRGHVCLPLDNVADGSLSLFGLGAEQADALLRELAAPALWPALFATSTLVGSEGEAIVVDRAASAPRWPLRLWHNKLYLTRYHDYEQQVAYHLQRLSRQQQQPAIAATLARLFARDYGTIFAALLEQRLTTDFSVRYFVEKYLDVVKEDEVPWPAVCSLLSEAQTATQLRALDQLIPDRLCCNGQRLAVATAVSRHFAVISGGPGTGKTTTVTKLLALLVEQGLLSGAVPSIRLVAPTGKAAARLTESIGAALEGLDLPPAWREAIPTAAGTLHRLLGVIPGRNQFRHHRGNPLHLDLLVVDEASMVDLPMMAKLLDALAPHARLILLGDKDQLASVEAGSVLGDICSFTDYGVSPEQATWLERQTGYQLQGREGGSAICDTLSLLTKSWRFDRHSGIGQLAYACNSGDPRAVEALWGMGFTDVQLHPWQGDAYEALIAQGVAGYAVYLKAARDGDDITHVFKAFNRFQILCALRDGPYGVAGINEHIETALSRAGWIVREGEWYQGRPVMVIANDHGLGLYNGDMGLCLPDESGRLKVWFEQADGSLRALLPSRLPPHETVYGMTIHKSQGSEFDHTVLVLPSTPSPLLTRELIYTGITRAKVRLDLYCDRHLLLQGIRKKTVRYSGLAQRLGLSC